MQNNQYYAKPEILKEKLFLLFECFSHKIFLFFVYLGNCKYVALGNQFDDKNKIQKLSI